MLEMFVYVLTITANDKTVIKVYPNSDIAEQSAEAYIGWRDDVHWTKGSSWHWIGSLFKDGRPAIDVNIIRKPIEDKYNNDWA